MDYKTVKSKVDKVFCVSNLREIYKSDKYDFKMSFLDLMFCIEDFYTFVYSTRLNKTSWLLFTWIRTLVRYDGYVKLSYKDISNKFCEKGKNIISKPTFFKCINELDEYGLIKKITNKKLFENKYQNDVNTYIVVNKIDEILPLLEQVDNHIEFYQLLRETYFNSELKKKQNKKVQTSEDKIEYSYEYVMQEYSEAKTQIEDLFKFLGSSNKSGKIAMSRKTKILNTIMSYYPDDKGLIYAIEQTITKGIKNEKYLYAIIRNLIGENQDESKNDDKVTKELKEKYKPKQKAYVNEYHLSDNEYNSLKQRVLNNERAFLSVLHTLKTKLTNLNEREQKLYNVCEKLKQKFAIHEQYMENRGLRVGILEEYEISECVGYDKQWNEIIYWLYDKDDSVVPLKVINQIAKKNKEAFTFSSIQFIDKGVYKE